MKRLENMKECLVSAVQAQMGNLQQADTKELGEAIDMIKDLEEAIYYCTITKAMNGEGEYGQGRDVYHYSERIKEPYPYDPYWRDMDRKYGRMYYDGNGGGNNGSSSNGNSNNGYNSSMQGNNARGGGTRGYQENYPREYEYYMPEMRDHREGRSGISRRTYMESKEMHKDKLSSLKDLEHYMKELGEDIAEMIEGSSQEEKQLLQKKLTMLAQKVTND